VQSGSVTIGLVSIAKPLIESDSQRLLRYTSAGVEYSVCESASEIVPMIVQRAIIPNG